MGITRPITQEIPIDLKLAEDIALAEPPQLPKPEVNIYLPPIKSLKSIIDKMRSMRYYSFLQIDIARLPSQWYFLLKRQADHLRQHGW